MTGSGERSSTATASERLDPEGLEYLDLRDHRDEELLGLIHAGGGLYAKSFPDEEREDEETHRNALWGANRDRTPLLHLIVARPRLEPRTITGFVMAEFYPRSRCGLISYIAVEGASRGRNLGKTLLGHATDALRADAAAAGPAGESAAAGLAALFAEIHDPARAAGFADSMAPLERVRVMHALGARRVPIPYVQPALSRDGSRVRRLMLVALPTAGVPPESLRSQVVRGFLRELYTALGIDAPERDVDFARAAAGLRDDVVHLSELVQEEDPAFVDGAEGEGAIAEYGIAIHLVLEPPRGRREQPAPADEQNAFDPLRSFEDDILAYPGQPGSLPFHTSTVPVPDTCALVSATFPAELTFRSEGRLVLLRCTAPDGTATGGLRRTRRFLLRASQTTFTHTGLSILHLVLGPDPADPGASTLDEYDLIKLMKLWQPGEGLARDGRDATPAADGRAFVSLRVGEHEPPGAGTADDVLGQLATAIFQLGERTLAIDGPRAGTVQVLHPSFARQDDRSGICAEIDAVVEGRLAGEPSKELKALGGLVCGLLDFGEIDRDELADVFREAIAGDEAVRSFHKTTLLAASASDRPFEAEGIRDSVGLSPYLLIPHAVLLHNDWCVSEALRKLDEAARRRRWLGVFGSKRLGTLERIRADVASALSQLVPDVFNYRDERTLYEHGTRARSLEERALTARRRLDDELRARIELRHQNRDTFIATTLAMLLLLLAANDAVDKLWHGAPEALVFGVAAGVMAAALVVLWFVLRRE